MAFQIKIAILIDQHWSLALRLGGLSYFSLPKLSALGQDNPARIQAIIISPGMIESFTLSGFFAQCSPELWNHKEKNTQTMGRLICTKVCIPELLIQEDPWELSVWALGPNVKRSGSRGGTSKRYHEGAVWEEKQGNVVSWESRKTSASRGILGNKIRKCFNMEKIMNLHSTIEKRTWINITIST